MTVDTAVLVVCGEHEVFERGRIVRTTIVQNTFSQVIRQEGANNGIGLGIGPDHEFIALCDKVIVGQKDKNDQKESGGHDRGKHNGRRRFVVVFKVLAGINSHCVHTMAGSGTSIWMSLQVQINKDALVFISLVQIAFSEIPSISAVNAVGCAKRNQEMVSKRKTENTKAALTVTYRYETV